MADREMRFEQLAMKDEKIAEERQFMKVRDMLRENQEQEAIIDHQLMEGGNARPDANTIEAAGGGSLYEQMNAEIKKARMKVVMQLSAMRRSALRRKKEKLAELFSVKTRLAQKLISEDRQGDAGRCDTKNPPQARVTWCYTTYAGSQSEIGQCLMTAQDPTQFCFSCCDKEYGALHLDMRKGCYKCCGRKDFMLSFKLPPLGPIPKECLPVLSPPIPPRCLESIVPSGTIYKTKSMEKMRKS